MLKGVFTEAFTSATTSSRSNNPRVAVLPIDTQQQTSTLSSYKKKPSPSSPSRVVGTRTTTTKSGREEKSTRKSDCFLLSASSADDEDVVGEDDEDGNRGNSSTKHANNKNTHKSNYNDKNVTDKGSRENIDNVEDDTTTSELVRSVIQQRLLNAHGLKSSHHHHPRHDDNKTSFSSSDEKMLPSALSPTISAEDQKKMKASKEEQAHKNKHIQQQGWTGQLIARVLPKEFVEYDVRKPPCQIDPISYGLSFPSSLLSSSTSSAFQNANSEELSRSSKGKVSDSEQGGENKDMDDSCEMKKVSTHSSSSLSSFSSSSNHNNHNFITSKCFGQKKDNIVSMDDDNLVVTIDLYLFRNDQEVPSSNNDNSSDGENRNNGNSDCSSREISPCSILHMHMNREATEDASRTLRRFEISTAKKIQSTLPTASGRGKRTRKKKKMPLNLKAQNVDSSSSVVVLYGKDLNDDNNELTTTSKATMTTKRELDISNLTSADLWREIASKYEADSSTRRISKVIVPLRVPDLTTPPTENEEENVEDDMMEIPINVLSCPPTILSVKTFESFNARIYTSVPLVIETNLLYATHAVVTWFANGVIVQKDSRCYTPTMDDVGKELCVVIIPVRLGHSGKGYEEAYKFKNKVEELPFMPIVSPIRDDWIHRRKRSVGEEGELCLSSSNDLRVLTYNILADLYTSRDIDQHLMYAHCDLEHLMRWRRMPMLIAEILAYDADLICLQEVDAMIFDSLLRPVLGAKGYQGYYSNKASTQMEGCAMFWSLDCFEITKDKDMHTFSIRDLFGDEGDVQSKDEQSEEGNPSGNAGTINSSDLLAGKGRRSLQKWDSMHAISNLMGEHEELRRVAKEKVGQIAQVATLTMKRGVASSFSPSPPFVNSQNGRQNSSCLTDKPGKIVVANTHLFYHPMADHIRAMQAYAICKKIDHLRRKGPASYPYPLVFCGDLNSNPMSGAVQLLFTRSLLPEHHECWKHLNDYVWEMGDNEYMIEHGYVGNEAQLEEGVEPTYIEEAFDDAHQDANSLNDESVAGDTIHPPAIILPPSFPNLVSGCPDMPNFTNYAVDFVETLDYVLASEPSKTEPYGFGPKSAAPMPSEEDVRRYVAMPNEFMPSDHVSVVCDLEWKTNGFLSGMNEV